MLQGWNPIVIRLKQKSVHYDTQFLTEIYTCVKFHLIPLQILLSRRIFLCIVLFLLCSAIQCRTSLKKLSHGKLLEIRKKQRHAQGVSRSEIKNDIRKFKLQYELKYLGNKNGVLVTIFHWTFGWFFLKNSLAGCTKSLHYLKSLFSIEAIQVKAFILVKFILISVLD